MFGFVTVAAVAARAAAAAAAVSSAPFDVAFVLAPLLATDDARLPDATTGTPTELPAELMLLALSTVCALMTMLPLERMPASPASMVPAGAKR